jgi:hypothetical protein
MMPLFIEGIEAEDIVYNHIRDSDSPQKKAAKEFVENLWAIYQPYADNNFPDQIQRSFHARFWEMYLTCTLLEQRFKLNCPKPGPDILISGDRKIWIEAIAPTAGDPSKPDSVPEVKFINLNFDSGSTTKNAELDQFMNSRGQRVPDEQIILRYRSAIAEKFDRRYAEYVAKGIVSNNDSYVVALNGQKVGFSQHDVDPPRILRSLFPIGHEEVITELDANETMKIVGNRFQFRPEIKKASGKDVSTFIFLSRDYENLSAVLFSSVGVINRPERMGQDFMLVHNPLAKNPLPSGFFKLGKEYTIQVLDNHRYQILVKEHR